MLRSLALCAPFLLIVSLFTGCSPQEKYVTVKGQVVVKGTNGGKLRVEFHPNAEKGTKGPSSSGITDDEGRFTLTYAQGNKSGEGAIVGWHKVVIFDMRLAESETGKGIPIRIPTTYSEVHATPLDVELLNNNDNLVIDVPKK